MKDILIILNYLIASAMLLVSLPDEGVDGWYSVEKKPKIEDLHEEEDRTIWVLFSKDLGLERILVRFPELPKYTYLENGDLEIRCERGGELFQLTVSKNLLGAAEAQELHYQHEGKWVHEQFVRSAHHFFHFKTVEISAETKIHVDLFSSFFIEKI